MGRARQWAAAAAVVASLGAGDGIAAPVTLNIQFSLSDFADGVDVPPATPPVTTITGDFTVTYEPGVATPDTAVGLTVTAVSFVPTSPLQFSVTAGGRLAFGGADTTPFYVLQGGPTDFAIALDLSDLAAPRFVNCAEEAVYGFSCRNFSGQAGTLAAAYTLASAPDSAWWARSATLTVTQVPEPGTLAMALLALGATAAARRTQAA